MDGRVCEAAGSVGAEGSANGCSGPSGPFPEAVVGRPPDDPPSSLLPPHPGVAPSDRPTTRRACPSRLDGGGTGAGPGHKGVVGADGSQLKPGATLAEFIFCSSS